MHRSFFFLVFAAACGRTDLLADAPVVEQPPPLELRRTVFMAVADRAWRLFATDGTADGTRAIGLVNVDTSGGVPEPGQSFGGRHYFPCAGALCVSDGATSTRFLDLNAHRLTVAAGSLFFLTDPGTLWRSVDGQSAAVVHSSPGTVSLLVANERALVFWADGALWRITPGDRESARVGDHLERVPDAVELGDTLFFVGFDPAHGKELWKSTGAGALERVTDLTPGPASSLSATELVVAGDQLFFVANSRQRVGLYSMRERDSVPTFRHEAWWYPQLTRVGAECAFAWDDTLWLASGDSVREAARGAHLWALSVARGKLHYTSREGASDVLWRLDESGPSELHRFSEQLFSVTSVDDALFFRGAGDSAGGEPWMVRGEEVTRIADLAAGSASSTPANFRAFTSTR